MQRVKIELPEKILYTEQFTIVEEDINEADHVGNERILVFANNIRANMFEHLQLKLNDGTNRHGTIIANHTINYKTEGFLHDKITCYVGVAIVTECSFDLIFNFVKDNGKTLAVLRTGCVYYEYQQRKIRHLPESFAQAFTGN